MKEEFYTFREYMDKNLTASMEDYIEMIYRLSKNSGYTRIQELAKSLNIRPPSATKMIQKLNEKKLLKYKKYDIIILEAEGKKLGEKLLVRHNMIEELLRYIGVNENNILSETEKIEHTISDETLNCIIKFIYKSDKEKN
ncbi:MAG: iron dependent repressor, metal binding and dimerization domain protein [Bacilli bacterium]|nr:iron dependent repressor, metal binding and dimerization domain protein [Bacilli bacterium]